MPTEKIAALLDDWSAALASGDADQIAELYAPDAVLLPTASYQIRLEPGQIRRYFRDIMQRTPSARFMEVHSRRFDTVGINSGIYTFKMHRSDGTPFELVCRFTFVYLLFDGVWKIIEHHSSIMPDQL
ncbi:MULTISPECIES: SgcJ/EcaC family oxidoreductase [Roseinatronobacter]|uniref:SgcJ/EcaC family oxidoreductase n=1 Tax=Roseinatronobacter domitianus TaxID=2940293 RepID=A0ABT0LZ31_9RHOB|nr:MULTISPECIES: SgcJ/EcaC family oxidoreductase [Roseibaca]MCL1627866.1 SgcJ/EcaC family oxidoreductase [Roseibaca domitiana]